MHPCVSSDYQVVFLLGVEGTGHHGVKLLLKHLIKESGHALLIGGEDEGFRASTERRDEVGMIARLHRFIESRTTKDHRGLTHSLYPGYRLSINVIEPS